MIIRNFIEKALLLISLAFCISSAQSQWQEITKFGPVKDFLYIDSNLQYIWGDTNYIVENGQARMVADFGFKKKNGDIYAPDQADFIKGKRIGFKIKVYPSNPARFEVYRTIDGGLNWNLYADHTLQDYKHLWLIPTAADSNTVYIEGNGFPVNPPLPGDERLPYIIKIQNNNKIELIKSKVEVDGNWVTIPGINYLYFFDSLYGLGILGPSSYIDNSSIVLTKNGGRNFKILDSSYFNKHWGEIIPVNKKVLLLLEGYNISISNDSGMNWKIISNIKYIDPKTDTFFTKAVVIQNELFYLRENLYFNSKNPTISILYHKKLMDSITDSVIIKPSKAIDCYDNKRCYMYGPNFYQNFNPIEHPLSNNKIPKNQVIKPKLIYHPDHIELVFPSSIQNNQYQLMLYDMSGKLVLTDHIPKKTGKYKLQLNENLPQGIYIISLRGKEEVFSLKFIQ